MRVRARGDHLFQSRASEPDGRFQPMSARRREELSHGVHGCRRPDRTGRGFTNDAPAALERPHDDLLLSFRPPARGHFHEGGLARFGRTA